MSSFGVIAAGPAFATAYLLHFLLLNILVRRIHGFCWQPLSLGLLIFYMMVSLFLLTLALINPTAAAVASLVLAAATGLFGLRVVLVKIGPEGKIATRLTRFYAYIGWTIRRTL